MSAMTEESIIFCDGSSRGNPGPGGWGAIVVSGGKARELGGGEAHTTNNRMEMTAALEALETLPSGASVIVHTDSSYLINGITKWVHGWKKNGWISSTKQDVVNRDLWEELDATVRGKKISWQHVSGHVGIPGNERCDEIATGFADGIPVTLYNGSADQYTVSLSTKAQDGALTAKKEKDSSRSRAKAYSYLSLLGGKLEIHKTWSECETRVKGKPAKFKKSISAEDEAKIRKEWGV